MALNSVIFPQPILAVRNRIEMSVQVASNWTTYDDYYVELRIDAETAYRSGLWQTYAKLANRAPMANNRVYFQVAEILEDLMQPEPPPANLLDRNPQRLGKAAQRIRFTLTEFINGAVGSAPYNITRHVVRAGFNQYDDQSFFKWAITDNKALTHQPALKDTTRFLPEYHTVVFPSNATGQLNFDVRFADGSTQTFTNQKSFAGLQYDVVRFPAGFEQIQLDNLAGTVTEWEVYVTAGGQPIGSRSSYRIDPYGDTPVPRYFLWEGSLGNWHSLRTRGERKLDAAVSSDRVMLVDPIGRNEDLMRDQRVRYENQVEQHSGYLPAGHGEWLLDLKISPEVYLTQDFGYLRKRIMLDRDTFTVDQDSEDLDRVVFNYRDATGAHRGL